MVELEVIGGIPLEKDEDGCAEDLEGWKEGMDGGTREKFGDQWILALEDATEEDLEDGRLDDRDETSEHRHFLFWMKHFFLFL